MADENLNKHWSWDPCRDLKSAASGYETEVPPVNSVEQSVWEANSQSATQDFPKILWKLESPCRIHVSRRHQQIHSTTFRAISILPSHLHLVLPSFPFRSGFTTKTYRNLFSPRRAACPAHLHLHCITIIFGDLTHITNLLIYRKKSGFSFSLAGDVSKEPFKCQARRIL